MNVGIIDSAIIANMQNNSFGQGMNMRKLFCRKTACIISSLFLTVLAANCGGGTGMIPPMHFTEEVTEDTTFEEVDGWITVPAGNFVMGCASGTICNDDEKPKHTVYVSEFMIQKNETTNSQYKECVDAGACSPPSSSTFYEDASYANRPVVYINHEYAKDYCNWIGARLPTEAEWEKAARGGCELSGSAACEQADERIYPWGNAAFSCSLANMLECTDDFSDIGAYAGGASPYGVMDMIGNAWEWVDDLYNEDYYATSPSQDPLGPASGLNHVVRGGSYGYNVDVSVSTRAEGNFPTSNPGFGYMTARCVK